MFIGLICEDSIFSIGVRVVHAFAIVSQAGTTPPVPAVAAFGCGRSRQGRQSVFSGPASNYPPACRLKGEKVPALNQCNVPVTLLTPCTGLGVSRTAFAGRKVLNRP